MDNEIKYKMLLLYDLITFTLATAVNSFGTDEAKIGAVNQILEAWDKRVSTFTKKSIRNILAEKGEEIVIDTEEDVLNILADISNIPRETVQKEVKLVARHNFMHSIAALKQKRKGDKWKI